MREFWNNLRSKRSQLYYLKMFPFVWVGFRSESYIGKYSAIHCEEEKSRAQVCKDVWDGWNSLASPSSAKCGLWSSLQQQVRKGSGQPLPIWQPSCTPVSEPHPEGADLLHKCIATLFSCCSTRHDSGTHHMAVTLLTWEFLRKFMSLGPEDYHSLT